MRRQLLVLALAVSACVPIASAGTVTISDGTFEDGDWSARSDASDVGATSGSRVPIGGNSGSYREITNSGFIPGIVFADTIGWHFFENETYDPRLGAILSIDYSEDALRSQAPHQFGRFALRQDGILFRSKQEYPIDSDPNLWMAHSLSDLGANDFEALFNGAFLPNGTPDFSTAGSPITFGFYRRSTSGRGSFNSRAGIDNWTITLTTESIPEPQSHLMGVLGLASWAIFRQKRTRRPLMIS